MILNEAVREAPEGVYKFLEMAAGEWRFWLAISMESHKEMSKGEAVKSAGCISLWRKNGVLEARMEDSWSSSLMIGCQSYVGLEMVLGVRVGSRWD